MPYSHKNRIAPRGSVIILVVAVLVLLVVIGTVFIISSRSERNTSLAMSSTANLSLARQGVMDVVRGTIGNCMYDTAGNPGGEDVTTMTGGYGTFAARTYDYPELGANGVTTYNTKIPSQPWLVKYLHVQSNNSTDVSQLTPAAYDPSKGTYSLGFKLYNPTTAFDTVVADQTTGDPFVPTTNEDGISPGTFPDAYINLLPFSDASGIRYRYGIRILDTSRMLNLNTGSTDDSKATGSLSDTNGQYISSLRLAPDPSKNPGPAHNFFNTSDAPPNLHFVGTSGLGRAGLSSSNNAFTLAGWQTQVFSFENLQDQGLSPFDISDELELRAYGEFGTSYRIRPAATAVWPNTFNNMSGTTVVGNSDRRFYTTISYSRELRPYPDPNNSTGGSGSFASFTLNGATCYPDATHSYPSINRIPVNGKLQDSTSLAQIATALGTAMIYTLDKDSTGNAITDHNNNQVFPAPSAGATPFQPDEVFSYVANFIESRWNGMVADPAITNATAYFLPAGPSFIDSQGICVRTATNATTPLYSSANDFKGSNDLKSTGNSYFGYAAQPFLNEVAVYATQANSASNPVPTDMAIELYNPYSIALSLKGFTLKVGGYSKTFTTEYIPANGFFILSAKGGQFDTAPSDATTPTDNHVLDANLLLQLGTTYTVTLTRPFAPRGAGALSGNEEIDTLGFSNLLNPAGGYFGTTAAAKSYARDNLIPVAPATTASEWGCAYNPPAASAIKTSSIGTLNGGTNGGYPLYDRFAGTPQYPTQAAQKSGFANIAEFNRIMRVGSILDVNGNTPNGVGLASTRVNALLTGSPGSPYTSMQFPADAQIYFDFKACSQTYTTDPNNAYPVDFSPPATIKPGDIRAVRLLDQLSFIDRISDPTIDIGGGGTDINKIRLPGQINVNTASGDVLRAIPNMTDQLVANILAYRDRGSKTVKYNTTASTTDYSSTATYPGLGIHSLAELIVPISDATSPGSLQARDAVWASVYNLCTVRSDTFVVYGLLEAVRVNPNYTGHNNGSDWYGAVTDDPTSNAAPNLRVARRRFVAIIDRSYCNYSRGDTNNKFVLPRILAIKDLPQ